MGRINSREIEIEGSFTNSHLCSETLVTLFIMNSYSFQLQIISELETTNCNSICVIQEDYRIMVL